MKKSVNVEAHSLSVGEQVSETSGSIPRRIVLKGGLVTLAGALAQAGLIGCSPREPNLSGSDSMMDPTDMTTAQEAGEASGGASSSGMPDQGIVEAGELAANDDGVVDEVADMMTSPDLEMMDQGSIDPDMGSPLDFPERSIPEQPALLSLISMIGPLQPADENGIRLPEGFRSRVIAQSSLEVPGHQHRWHLAPDGGATYPTEDGGWIYVSNAEMDIIGGVSAIRFGADGEITDAYPILERTNRNCAGGVTPWHTWLSCEERTRGQVFECSPWGDREAIARPALGVFRHEAVAVDPINGHLYLTEDERDGRLYRFTAHQTNRLGFPDLSAGTLEVAAVTTRGEVSWIAIPDPEYLGETPTRYQVEESTPFNGGEGIWYHDAAIYFSTKGDNKVRAYHIERAELETIYDGEGGIEGVDNLTVSCCGDVLVAEDGGSMQIVAISPDGELKPLIQIEGQDDSEVTGPAFDPSGTRLYFSSQRGISGRSSGGITYEVTGPFHQLLER